MTDRHHELRALKCTLDNIDIQLKDALDFADELEAEDTVFHLVGALEDMSNALEAIRYELSLYGIVVTNNK